MQNNINYLPDQVGQQTEKSDGILYNEKKNTTVNEHCAQKAGNQSFLLNIWIVQVTVLEICYI